MRNSIKKAIGNTIEDMLNAGLGTSFSEKELKDFNVKIPDIDISSTQIKEIRKKTHLSQSVFAKLLNVSPSSVRQWEQGKRRPTGSTKVLLDLMKRKPHILNYRVVTRKIA
jgi:putative transcriptional regulator